MLFLRVNENWFNSIESIEQCTVDNVGCYWIVLHVIFMLGVAPYSCFVHRYETVLDWSCFFLYLMWTCFLLHRVLYHRTSNCCSFLSEEQHVNDMFAACDDAGDGIRLITDNNANSWRVYLRWCRFHFLAGYSKGILCGIQPSLV